MKNKITAKVTLCIDVKTIGEHADDEDIGTILENAHERARDALTQQIKVGSGDPGASVKFEIDHFQNIKVIIETEEV